MIGSNKLKESLKDKYELTIMLKALKAMAKYQWHLSNLVAFIRLNIFGKVNLQNGIDKLFEEHYDPLQKQFQGVLF